MNKSFYPVGQAVQTNLTRGKGVPDLLYKTALAMVLKLNIKECMKQNRIKNRNVVVAVVILNPKMKLK